MKVRLNREKRVAIQDFADKHNLVMEVNDRGLGWARESRFYAHFAGMAEVKDRNVLIGTFGDGSSPTKAMQDYAKQISGKLLVVDAMKETGREIEVPGLYYDLTRKMEIE